MPINGKQTYYEFFGLENFEADTIKIKKSYRSLALKWHPDRNENKVDAERMMKQVNEIYRVLSSEKAQYDRYLKRRMGVAEPYESPFKKSSEWSNQSFKENFDFDFESVFRDMQARRYTEKHDKMDRHFFVDELTEDEFRQCKEFIMMIRGTR